MKKEKAVSEELKKKCRIVTPEFRVSYPHLFKAVQVNGKGEPKYSVTMMFKKSADLTPIKQAIKAAKMVEFGKNKEDWPDDLESPVVDGDSPKYAKKEGYKGHWIIKAISNEAFKPTVVDDEVEPIIDASVVYPGCYARAQIFARCWEYMNKQGIHFILDMLQKTRDGKPIGGRMAAKDVFSPIDAGVDDEGDDDADSDEDDEQGFK